MTSTVLDSVSPDSSWANELPDPEFVESPDSVEVVNPPANACLKCGEPIVREAGARGRLPKRHPWCRPERRTAGNASRVIRVGKEEEVKAAQVEILIEKARLALSKAVALASIVDPYDAFVIHVNAPEILDNLRAVLMSWDWLRKQAAMASTGGSLFGLVLCVFTTLLPIAAHHRLIPSRKLSQVLINMPMFLLRMQEAMAAGNEGDVTSELLRRVSEQQRVQQEAQMRRQSAENVSASNG